MSVAAGGWLRIYIFPLNFIFLPLWLKLSILLIIIRFFFLSLYFFNLKELKKIGGTSIIIYFLGSIWLLPYISTFTFAPITNYGQKILKFVDQGWVEFLGGQGFIDKSKLLSSKRDVLNSISLKFFLFRFFVGGLILLLGLV